MGSIYEHGHEYMEKGLQRDEAQTVNSVSKEFSFFNHTG